MTPEKILEDLFSNKNVQTHYKYVRYQTSDNHDNIFIKVKDNSYSGLGDYPIHVTVDLNDLTAIFRFWDSRKDLDDFKINKDEFEKMLLKPI